jgi:ATP-dependent RNA helicase RhlE
MTLPKEFQRLRYPWAIRYVIYLSNSWWYLDRTCALTTFSDLDLIEPLQRAVADSGYEQPSPVQSLAIPFLLQGRDVLVCAQTGTGKTAAFSLPILQHLAKRPRSRGKLRIRALVMTPTRELAAQIGESLGAYGRFLRIRHKVIFGGVSEGPQITALRTGFEVLVATPGRLLDLVGRGFIDLSAVEFFVLDEADRMLDMGFIRDVRRVLPLLPQRRQNLLFSATIPPTIQTLASEFLHQPEFIAVTPKTTTVEKIQQSVMFVERANKRHLLFDLLNSVESLRAIVFTRTKHGADRLTKQLNKAGLKVSAIHGNKSQGARKRSLKGFRDGEVQVLVATDIASRGIDVDDVSHVFNYDLPNEPESYVHRIGRTARAGREGVAISFCDPTEADYLTSIERTIRQSIPRVLDHEYHCAEAVPVARSRASKSRPSKARSQSRGQARGSSRSSSRASSTYRGPSPKGRRNSAAGSSHGSKQERRAGGGRRRPSSQGGGSSTTPNFGSRSSRPARNNSRSDGRSQRDR